MPTATYRLEIDFNNDGSFAHAQSDVSADLLALPRARRGRNYGSQLYGRSIAGQMTVRLRNDTQKYDRFNPQSPLHNILVPDLLVRFSMRLPSTIPYITLWTGYLDNVERIERRGGRDEARLTALGIIAQLTQRQVSSPMRTNIATEDAMIAVLDAAGIPASRRGTIEGALTMARWWVGEQRAIDAMHEIEETEGGFVHENADGQIAVDESYARATGASAIPGQVLSDTPAAGEIHAEMIMPDDPTQDIVNSVTVPIRTYETAAEAVLWTLAETTELAAGGRRTFVIEYPNEDSPRNHLAVESWTALAANTDYTANSAADGSGTDLTSSLSITTEETARTLTITATNSHASSTLFITLLQARGEALITGQPVSVHVDDPGSIDQYGLRTYLVPAQFISTTSDAADYGGLIISLLSEPTTKIKASFDAGDHLAYAANLDLSARITVRNRGISEDFFVEAIEHIVHEGLRHVVNLTLSPAEPYGTVMVLGTGRLGSAILGR